MQLGLCCFIPVAALSSLLRAMTLLTLVVGEASITRYDCLKSNWTDVGYCGSMHSSTVPFGLSCHATDCCGSCSLHMRTL